MNKKMALFAVSLLMFSGVDANAGFIGKVMEAHVYVPPSPFLGPGGTYSSATFQVNNSVELPLFGVLNESSVDVSDNNVLVSFHGPASTYFSSGVYVFQDINSTINGITGVNLNSATGGFLTSSGAITPFDASRITFNENNIFVDLSGIGANANTRLSFDVSFSAVPIPAAVWLFSSGLLALTGFVRSSRKKC